MLTFSLKLASTVTCHTKLPIITTFNTYAMAACNGIYGLQSINHVVSTYTCIYSTHVDLINYPQVMYR